MYVFGEVCAETSTYASFRQPLRLLSGQFILVLVFSVTNALWPNTPGKGRPIPRGVVAVPKGLDKTERA